MSEEKKRYELHEMATIATRFGSVFMENTAKDYGTGEMMYTAEMHILSYIADNPGILSVQLARDWNRTKGAISQIIKKLETKELIYKVKESGNKNQLRLFVTEKGMELDKAHKKFDEECFRLLTDKMKESFTEEEMESGFYFMKRMIEISCDWELVSDRKMIEENLGKSK